jgi:FAD/FMN-containing dehydrogenase
MLKRTPRQEGEEGEPPCPTLPTHRCSRPKRSAAVYERREETAEHEDWVTKFAAALEQGDTGVYVNFLGDEGEARVSAAYPGSTWERLVEIKGRYDPTNLFRLNQNIPPASGQKEAGDG